MTNLRIYIDLAKNLIIDNHLIVAGYPADDSGSEKNTAVSQTNF